jgi:hypothetical protein
MIVMMLGNAMVPSISRMWLNFEYFARTVDLLERQHQPKHKCQRNDTTRERFHKSIVRVCIAYFSIT